MARRVFNELLDQLQNKFILLETSKKLVSGLFCNQELCRWPSCVLIKYPAMFSLRVLEARVRVALARMGCKAYLVTIHQLFSKNNYSFHLKQQSFVVNGSHPASLSVP